MQTLFLSFFFVTLYGSGFIATQIGLTFADPYSLLTARFFLTASILVIISLLFKLKWPSNFIAYIHTSISGLLIIGVFSIGVSSSIHMGLPAATSALIISFQPILVSILSCLLFKTEISRQQWLALVVGLAGVFFILMHKVGLVNIQAVLMSVVGLLGLGLGSLYQKKFCSHMNIFTGGAIHTSISGLMCLIFTLLYPGHHIVWTHAFIGALLWMSIAVSIGALSLLYILIKQHEIDRVSSLFYLMPVSSVILSSLLLKESVSLNEIIGIIVTSLAVFFINLHRNNASNQRTLCQHVK